MSDYLVFNELDVKGRKTKVFEVRNNTHDAFLGTIDWSSAWRQYVFNQVPDEVKWSCGCLKQLYSFIDKLMIEWKKNKGGDEP